MPHVRLSGRIDFDALFKTPPAFRFSVVEEDLHVKYREAFLASGRRAVLLRYVVSEGRLVQHVQLLVVQEEGGLALLKVDRGCPVLKSPGVKLLLATVAQWLVARGATVAATNLAHFAERAAFYAAHGLGTAEEAAEGAGAELDAG